MAKAWCWLKLSNGYKVKIDQSDFERVNQHSWRATEGTTGRLRVVTSIRGPRGPRSVTLGKFLMNPKPGQQVYPRRFNDGLDYRKSNLIVCSLAERQQQLMKRRVAATSKYRGVSYSRTDGKWKAGIKVEGTAINLGQFNKEEDAAVAYNTAARKYFGEFAYQNLIQKTPRRKSDLKKKSSSK